MTTTRCALLCVLTFALGIVWNAATVQTAQAKSPGKATAAAC